MVSRKQVLQNLQNLLLRLQQYDKAIVAASYAWNKMMDDYVALKTEVIRLVQLLQTPPAKPKEKEKVEGA